MTIKTYGNRMYKLGQQDKEKEMLDNFIRNINKRIMEVESLSCDVFAGKSSVLYELKDLKKIYEERLQKLTGDKKSAKQRKPKVEIYCKNPLCFNTYLARHKIKEIKEERQLNKLKGAEQ